MGEKDIQIGSMKNMINSMDKFFINAKRDGGKFRIKPRSKRSRFNLSNASSDGDKSKSAVINLKSKDYKSRFNKPASSIDLTLSQRSISDAESMASQQEFKPINSFDEGTFRKFLEETLKDFFTQG